MLMAQLVTNVGSSALGAKYLASDRPGERVPRPPGHICHAWDDRGTDLANLIYGDHVDARYELVRQWCQYRNIRKGIDGPCPVASFYSFQRPPPHAYHGIDEDVRDTATRWNTGLSQLIDSPPMRPWSVVSPRALGCTFFEVLSEYIDHTHNSST